MSFERGNIGTAIIGKFAIAAVADAIALAVVPNKSAFVIGNFSFAFGSIAATAAAIAAGPCFFEVVRGICTHAPVVAIGAHFAIGIKVVEQHKLCGQLVLIGGIFFAKKQQRSIAIATRNITKYLIVSSVFFDDVKHVFDRRRLRAKRALALRQRGLHLAGVIRRIGIHLLAVFSQCFVRRQVYHAKRAGKQAADILLLCYCTGIGQVAAHTAAGADGAWSPGIGF